MPQFILRRVLISIPTLIGISLILYIIISLAPGDPFGQLALNPNVPPGLQAQLRKQYGLDDPAVVQYGKWASQLVRGNWGVSFLNHVKVTTLIWQRLGTTLLVVGAAYLLAVLIAIPVGIISAVKQYSWLDYVFTTFAFLGYSLPTFCTGLLFIIIFTVKLHWLPEIYTTNVPGSGIPKLWEILRHAIMPIMVLALFQAAELTRYVRTARAKGLSEQTVTIRHAVRNALIPVVTIMAIQIPTIFTGALITEQIFRVPGIGTLLLTSINSKDIPVIMGIVFTYAILVVAFNLLADVLYGVLDPRIKYS